MKYRYHIGIDCGVNTGFALWDSKEKLLSTSCGKIHIAMEVAKDLLSKFSNEDKTVKLYVEDARKRKWFGNSGKEKLQGAGSVKRDAKIWEDYLTYLKADFEMVAPKNNKTKLSAEQFRNITGYKAKTNEHSRDAAMLVFGRI